MSTQYNGVQGNVVAASVALIQSSTNAAPIVITTQTAAHGLLTGERVIIAQHTTNTAANGLWTITVLSANTFSLNGSTGNGVGGATGSYTPLGFNPNNYAIPSDGDAPTASSVNVALQILGDRTAWLKNRVGRMTLRDYSSLVSDDTTSPPATYWTSSSSLVFTAVTGVTLAAQDPVIAGDVIEGVGNFTVSDGGGAVWCWLEWRYQENNGTITRIPGTRQRVMWTAGEFVSVTLPFSRTVATGGPFSISLYGETGLAGSTFVAAGAYTVQMRTWRAAVT